MAAIQPTSDLNKASMDKDGFHAWLISLHGYLTGLLASSGTAADARAALGVPTAGTKSATATVPGLNYEILQIQPVTASVAANALTLGLDPTTLGFRSPTLTSGAVNTRQVAAAISLAVPDTATLGTVNAVAARLALLAIDNAGTVELAVVNLAGGNSLDETTLISTTAISATADADNVVYSTTARTNVPFRVVGFVDITEATAGTWATAPTLVQGAGGQALSGIDGRTWQNVAGSRAIGTTYYNTTGHDIEVSASFVSTTSGAYGYLYIDGVNVGASGQGFAATASLPSVSATIPPGSSYSFATGGGTWTLSTWAELR